MYYIEAFHCGVTVAGAECGLKGIETAIPSDAIEQAIAQGADAKGVSLAQKQTKTVNERYQLIW